MPKEEKTRKVKKFSVHLNRDTRGKTIKLLDQDIKTKAKDKQGTWIDVELIWKGKKPENSNLQPYGIIIKGGTKTDPGLGYLRDRKDDWDLTSLSILKIWEINDQDGNVLLATIKGVVVLTTGQDGKSKFEFIVCEKEISGGSGKSNAGSITLNLKTAKNRDGRIELNEKTTPIESVPLTIQGKYGSTFKIGITAGEKSDAPKGNFKGVVLTVLNLQKIIRQQAEKKGLRVAFAVRDDKHSNEFLVRGGTIVRPFNALSLSATEPAFLTTGVTLVKTYADINKKIVEIQKRVGEADPSLTLEQKKIRHLIIFCHGGQNWIRPGPDASGHYIRSDNYQAGGQKTSLEKFVNGGKVNGDQITGIRDLVTKDVLISLCACSAGRSVYMNFCRTCYLNNVTNNKVIIKNPILKSKKCTKGHTIENFFNEDPTYGHAPENFSGKKAGEKSFSDALLDMLLQNKISDPVIWGHTVVGHTSQNPYLRVFTKTHSRDLVTMINDHIAKTLKDSDSQKFANLLYKCVFLKNNSVRTENATCHICGKEKKDNHAAVISRDTAEKSSVEKKMEFGGTGKTYYVGDYGIEVAGIRGTSEGTPRTFSNFSLVNNAIKWKGTPLPDDKSEFIVEYVGHHKTVSVCDECYQKYRDKFMRPPLLPTVGIQNLMHLQKESKSTKPLWNIEMAILHRPDDPVFQDILNEIVNG